MHARERGWCIIIFFLDKLPWSYQAYAIHNYGLASLSTHWCAGALITHCIHQRQFFHFVQSPVMQCVTCSFNCLQRDWTHSKCFGEILQRILYESMTSVLYSFWQADVHQLCCNAWEVRAAECQFDSDQIKMSPSLGANCPHTYNSRYHLAYIKAILISCRDHAQCFIPRPVTAMLPPTATSNMLLT